LKVELLRAVNTAEKERSTPYATKVVKMYNDYEETVFNLSEQSANETIKSIKEMSLGQRMKFQELITKRNLKNQKKNGQEV
jgi:hypothetical protein